MSDDLRNELKRIADALAEKRNPEPSKPWWKTLPYKDITIITGLILFLFSVRTEITKIQDAGNRTAVSDAVIKSIEMINEDITFRGLYSKNVSKVRNQLLDQARVQTPNDPFVITLALFSRQVDLTRDPKSEDGPEILALARYPASIDPQSIHADEASLKMYGKWLNISGAALLNLIVKNEDIQKSPLLGPTYYEVAYACLKKAADNVSNKRELLQTYSLLIQHHIRGTLYKYPPNEGADAILASAERLSQEFKKSTVRVERLTGMDGSANLAHLRGQIMHLHGDYAGAIKQYEQSLTEYNNIRNIFPDRQNPNEIHLVMYHFENAKKKAPLNAM